jgi:hypothetical protein
MDRQTCLLTLESYNYNNQEVDMQWSEIAPPFLLLKDPIVLPDFILSNYSTYMSKVVRVLKIIKMVFLSDIRLAHGTN